MNNVQALLEAIITGGMPGVAMVFCIMWWLERKDRIKAEAHVFELAVTSADTSHTLTKIIAKRQQD